MTFSCSAVALVSGAGDTHHHIIWVLFLDLMGLKAAFSFSLESFVNNIIPVLHLENSDQECSNLFLHHLWTSDILWFAAYVFILSDISVFNECFLFHLYCGALTLKVCKIIKTWSFTNGVSELMQEVPMETARHLPFTIHLSSLNTE